MSKGNNLDQELKRAIVAKIKGEPLTALTVDLAKFYERYWPKSSKARGVVKAQPAKAEKPEIDLSFMN